MVKRGDRYESLQEIDNNSCPGIVADKAGLKFASVK